MKDAYEALRKEHPILPSFEAMNNDFELDTIEQKAFLLRQIKRKMGEKLEPILEMLEKTFSPDPNSFSDMYECRALNSGEKKQLLEVFRHLMEQYRSIFETDLLCEDTKDAETVRRIFDVWHQDKKTLIPLIKKIRESWQKQVEPREILEYLG